MTRAHQRCGCNSAFLCKCFESRANSWRFSWRLTAIMLVCGSSNMPLRTLYNVQLFWWSFSIRFACEIQFTAIAPLVFILFHVLFCTRLLSVCIIICTYRLSGARQLAQWRQFVAIKKFFFFVHSLRTFTQFQPLHVFLPPNWFIRRCFRYKCVCLCS